MYIYIYTHIYTYIYIYMYKCVAPPAPAGRAPPATKTPGGRPGGGGGDFSIFSRIFIIHIFLESL